MMTVAYDSESGSDGNHIAPDPVVPTRIKVTLDNLVSYDKNPRKTRNPNYDDIKASIRNRGLDHAPNITRISPSDPYMVKDGGNTRIEILKELYEEAKNDPDQDEQRFFVIDCMFHPYTNDIDMLAGHMIENEMRGHTLFIERAIAAAQFREHFQQQPEFADGISIRELSRQISSSGWTVNQSNLNQMMYAHDVLLPIVPNALWEGMGRDHIKKVRKLLTDGGKLWEALAKDTDPSYESVWQAAFRELDEKDMFDYDEALLGLERAIAQCFDCQLPHIQAELQAVMQGAEPPTERPTSAFDRNPVVEEKVDPPAASVTPIRPSAAPTSPQSRSASTEQEDQTLTSSLSSASFDTFDTKEPIGRAEPTPERIPNDMVLSPHFEDAMTAKAMINPYPNDTLRPEGTNYVYPNSALSRRFVRRKGDGEATPIEAMMNLPFEQFICEWDYYGGGPGTRIRILKHRLTQEAFFMSQLWAIDDVIIDHDSEERYNDFMAPAFTFNEQVAKRVIDKYQLCKERFFLERNFQDPEVHLRWRQLGILCYMSDVISFCMEDFAWGNNSTDFLAFPNFHQIDAHTMRMGRAKIAEIRALGACPHSEDIFKDTAFYMACIDACMGAIMHWRIIATKQEEYLSHGYPID
jgi:ParB family protein of integrating conjugative element (PFGI_1 class)